MRNSRKLILGAALLAGAALSPQAQAGVTVIVNAGGSVPTEISTAQAIKFPTGQVEVLAEQPYSWAISDVVSIKFATTTTSISAVDASAKGISMRKHGTVITIQGAADEKGGAEIYSLTGAKVYNNPAWQGEDIDVASLARGIYILKINNSTFKFTR